MCWAKRSGQRPNSELAIRLWLLARKDADLGEPAGCGSGWTRVMSVSGRRPDNCRFTPCHELAPVRRQHGTRADENLTGERAVPSNDKPQAEREADHWAGTFLLPSQELDQFIRRVKPYDSKARIDQFAKVSGRTLAPRWFCRGAT